jgi:hypothetical protein
LVRSIIHSIFFFFSRAPQHGWLLRPLAARARYWRSLRVSLSGIVCSACAVFGSAFLALPTRITNANAVRELPVAPPAGSMDAALPFADLQDLRPGKAAGRRTAGFRNSSLQGDPHVTGQWRGY